MCDIIMFLWIDQHKLHVPWYSIKSTVTIVFVFKLVYMSFKKINRGSKSPTVKVQGNGHNQGPRSAGS